MKSGISYLSLALALNFLMPIHTLCASDPASSLKLGEIKPTYPKVSAWSQAFCEKDDIVHQALARSLSGADQLYKALSLVKQGKLSGFFYYEALINNPKAPSYFKDRAIMERSGTIFHSLASFSNIMPAQQLQEIWNESLQCLKFLANRQDISRYMKIESLMHLAGYYNPTVCTLSPQADKCEEYFLQALKYKMDPAMKACILNDIAVLYHNKVLGQGVSGMIQAYQYYDKIDQDESIPLEQRLQSRINKAKVLYGCGALQDTLKQRQALVQSILDQEGAGPEVKLQAKYHAASFKVDEFEQSPNMNIMPAGLGHALMDLCVISRNSEQFTTLFDDQDLLIFKLSYVKILLELMYSYSLAIEEAGVEKNEPFKILKEVIAQENTVLMDTWAEAVVIGARYMLLNEDKSPSFLGDKTMSELIYMVLDNHGVSQANKNTMKALKAMLVAKGLLEEPNKDKILQDLHHAIHEKWIPESSRVHILMVCAQKTQEISPTYNNNIDKMIEFLKTALKTTKDPDDQLKIKYILYTYSLAYRECRLATEVIAGYVQDLSSPDTPEAYRIYITEDDDSEEETTEQTSTSQEQDTSEQEDENVSDSSTSQPTKTSYKAQRYVKHISAQQTPVAPSSTSSTTTNPKLERDITRAQLLLEKLNESRGKVTQAEVTNMLRRLNHTFQPTADNTLTLHVGHKGKKNKKGTPGQLDGGRKAALARELAEAIKQAKIKTIEQIMPISVSW